MKKEKDQRSSLERALDLLSLVHNVKQECSLYCEMESNFATAFNMVVGVGTAIEEDLAACPQIDLLRAAITRCGESYAITQLSPQKLLVRSGEFHAYIPCVTPASLYRVTPDLRIAGLNDRFMEALAVVAPLASTTGERVIDCSIQLNDGAVIATNRTVLIEAWHGNSFPSGLLIPKSSYMILKRSKKKVIAFGFSPDSVTFYFEDYNWLYTKLFKDKWPDVQNHLNLEYTTRNIPADFFAAAKKVSPFGNGSVYVEGNLVSSHPPNVKEEGSGLALTVEGVTHEPRIYAWNDLALIAKHALRWDEKFHKQRTMFTGDNLRGLVYHGEQTDSIANQDEDIPF